MLNERRVSDCGEARESMRLLGSFAVIYEAFLKSWIQYVINRSDQNLAGRPRETP
jgi:hypothetical protein